MIVAFGYLMALSSVVPESVQLARTLRTRRTSGISPTTQFSFMLSWACWSVYGMLLGDGPILLSALMGLAVSSGMVVVLRGLGHIRSPREILAPVLGYAAAAVLLLLDVRTGGVLLALVDVTMFLPQMVVAVRRDDLSGLSPVAVGWELTTSTGWVSYTVLRGVPEAGLYSSLYALMLAVVAYRLVRVRRRDGAGRRGAERQ